MITVIKLKEKDVIVVEVVGDSSMERIESVKGSLGSAFPDNDVLVLSAETKLSIIKSEK
jgi:hypothetical protein